MQPTSPSRATSRLLILLSAFLFSTGGAAIKGCGLSATQIASFRSGVAALALALLLPESRRGWTWRTGIVGISYAATLVCFVVANKTTTSANAIFLQATAPIYLLVLGPFVLHERLHRSDLVTIAAVAAGAVLMFAGTQNPMATAPNPAVGNLFALVSGLTWALTITGLRWLERGGKAPGAAISTVVAGNLITFAACLPLGLPIRHFSPADAMVLLYLGVFQIGLAYAALTRSVRHVPALEASTLLLVEPALNPFWTWLVHGERPGVWPVLGGVLVITAALVNARVRGQAPDEYQSPQ